MTAESPVLMSHFPTGMPSPKILLMSRSSVDIAPPSVRGRNLSMTFRMSASALILPKPELSVPLTFRRLSGPLTFPWKETLSPLHILRMSSFTPGAHPFMNASSPRDVKLSFFTAASVSIVLVSGMPMSEPLSSPEMPLPLCPSQSTKPSASQVSNCISMSFKSLT